MWGGLPLPPSLPGFYGPVMSDISLIFYFLRLRESTFEIRKSFYYTYSCFRS